MGTLPEILTLSPGMFVTRRPACLQYRVGVRVGVGVRVRVGVRVGVRIRIRIRIRIWVTVTVTVCDEETRMPLGESDCFLQMMKTSTQHDDRIVATDTLANHVPEGSFKTPQWLFDITRRRFISSLWVHVHHPFPSRIHP